MNNPEDRRFCQVEAPRRRRPGRSSSGRTSSQYVSTLSRPASAMPRQRTQALRLDKIVLADACLDAVMTSGGSPCFAGYRFRLHRALLCLHAKTWTQSMTRRGHTHHPQKTTSRPGHSRGARSRWACLDSPRVPSASRLHAQGSHQHRDVHAFQSVERPVGLSAAASPKRGRASRGLQ